MAYRKLMNLSLLERRKKKDGSGWWYIAHLVGETREDGPRMIDAWLEESLGEELMRKGVKRNVDVWAYCGIDDNLRMSVVGIEPVEESDTLLNLTEEG